MDSGPRSPTPSQDKGKGKMTEDDEIVDELEALDNEIQALKLDIAANEKEYTVLKGVAVLNALGACEAAAQTNREPSHAVYEDWFLLATDALEKEEYSKAHRMVTTYLSFPLLTHYERAKGLQLQVTCLVIPNQEGDFDCRELVRKGMDECRAAKEDLNVGVKKSVDGPVVKDQSAGRKFHGQGEDGSSSGTNTGQNNSRTTTPIEAAKIVVTKSDIDKLVSGFGDLLHIVLDNELENEIRSSPDRDGSGNEWDDEEEDDSSTDFDLETISNDNNIDEDSGSISERPRSFLYCPSDDEKEIA